MTSNVEKKEVPRHRHCPVCGVSMEIESQVCSSECQNEYEKIVRKNKRSRMVSFVALIALMVLIIVVPVISNLLFPSA